MINNYVVYVDSSAFAALLHEQSETLALIDWLEDTTCHLVSTDLLETELRRLAQRESINQQEVTHLLDGVSLAALDRATFQGAAFLPMPFLRTLDALHLESALRLHADAILTYDRRMSEAAEILGLNVISPR
ncbi:MAG: type II toxin-antitoxin system VapC family toxin [Actinomycetaceae bacterium]|nr:type II toxin-antitoxin system VapC family toxin [Actinomycetaceae bacterium]